MNKSLKWMIIVSVVYAVLFAYEMDQAHYDIARSHFIFTGALWLGYWVRGWK